MARNILYSLIIKGGSMAANFLMVPLTLGVLESTQYGIWITLSSVIGWFSFFDIGLSNGLRKFYSEAMASGDTRLAREYVSTTFAMLILIIVTVDILFFFLNPLIDWSSVLNCDPALREELSLLAAIVFYTLSVRFVVNMVSQLLIADMKTAFNDFLNFLGNILTLGLIVYLTRSGKGSLMSLGMAYSFIPMAVFLVATLLLFFTRYRQVRPSFRYIRKNHSGTLFSLGFRYFFLQVTAVLLLTFQNLIIAQVFGPAEVTPYNIVTRYFSIIFVIYSIIISPLLPAYTQAYFTNDLGWIRRISSKFLHLGYLFFAGILLMIFVSGAVYRIWIGTGVAIPIMLTAAVGILNMIHIWNSLFLSLINGIGKIRVQTLMSVFTLVLIVPVSVLLCRHTSLGITGVVVAQILFLIPGLWVNRYQFEVLINNTARGIWNR